MRRTHYEPGEEVYVNVFGSDSEGIVMCMRGGEVIVKSTDPALTMIGPLIGQFELKHVRPRAGQ